MDDKRTKRPQRPPDELVSQYREIGIPAVAAAARYQSRDQAGARPRQQEESREENAQEDSQEDLPAERTDARRRSVAGK
jgi:ribosomal protein L12E/L44/L45/RPP1/RPP2